MPLLITQSFNCNSYLSIKALRVSQNIANFYHDITTMVPRCSRWQTALTIWTLSRYYPVIPSVAYPLNDSHTIMYYRFTMPYLRTWSTCQSFSLAHLCHYAVIDHSWSLSPRLSYVYLLDPSDDLLEGTVPVKLPIRHVPLINPPSIAGGDKVSASTISWGLSLAPYRLPHTCEKWWTNTMPDYSKAA